MSGYSNQWRLNIAPQADAFVRVSELMLMDSAGGVNLCVDGIAFGSIYSPQCAFDGIPTTDWWSADGAVRHMLGYQFPAPVAIVQYSIRSSNTTPDGMNVAPRSWRLEYYESTTGNWITADSQTLSDNWIPGTTRTFNFSTPASVTTIVTSGTTAGAGGSTDLVDTAICNMALGRIGVSQFMDDALIDATMAGVVCRKFYSGALERSLGAGVWQFLQKTVELTPSGSGTLDWAYRYNYPSDCVQAEAVTGAKATYLSEYYLPTGVLTADMPFAIAQNEAGTGQSILCNSSPAYLTYAGRITNAGQFPWLFKSAVAWALAVEIASPLSAAPNMAASAEKAYRSVVADALANDGNEQQQPERCNDFTAARL